MLSYRVDFRRLDQRYNRRFGAGRVERRPGAAVSPVRFRPRSFIEASRGLVAPEVIRSLPFRKRAMGSLDYTGVQPALLEFKRAFDKQLWQYHVYPVLCLYLGTDYLRYIHYPRAYDLCFWEWQVIAGVAGEVSHALDVPMKWGGGVGGENFEPSLWELGDGAELVEGLAPRTEAMGLIKPRSLVDVWP